MSTPFAEVVVVVCSRVAFRLAFADSTPTEMNEPPSEASQCCQERLSLTKVRIERIALLTDGGGSAQWTFLPGRQGITALTGTPLWVVRWSPTRSDWHGQCAALAPKGICDRLTAVADAWSRGDPVGV